MPKVNCSVCGCVCDEAIAQSCPKCEDCVCDECGNLCEGYCQGCYDEVIQLFE